MGKRLRKIMSTCTVFPQSVPTLQRDPEGHWGKSQHLDIQMKVENAATLNYFLFRFTT